MEDSATSLNTEPLIHSATNGSLENADVEMKDEHPTEPSFQAQIASPLPQSTTNNTSDLVAPSQPQLPSLPSSAQSSSQPSAPVASTSTPPMAPPLQPNPHGAPTRVYLNQNVTPYLLEGMKYLAAYEPEKPLQWLSQYLDKKSKEVEGK